MTLREQLRDKDVRPLIKHRLFRLIDHAHNARIDDSLYHQCSMCETVFSAIKRTLGTTVSVRTWCEFREVALMYIINNIKRAVKA
jgi:IS5 family transposase